MVERVCLLPRQDTSACQEQLEALSAHMDYIQENITDCQTTIMEIEVIGCSAVLRLFASYSDRVRRLLDHFALTKG